MLGPCHFSPCRRWRYTLSRTWDETRPTVLFIGLNPSTADEEQDDPTIRRCIGFAKRWGFGRYLMGNIFAWRSTDPAALRVVRDPVGRENDAWLQRMAAEASLVIAAWGAHGAYRDRGRTVLELLGDLHCLGTTQSGQPKHPLYLKATTRRRRYVADSLLRAEFAPSRTPRSGRAHPSA